MRRFTAGRRSNTRSRFCFMGVVAALCLSVLASAHAEDPPAEWEYLVVSYGETYFSQPLSLNADKATFSKVQRFSEIGVTLPSEAINFQRNVDVLGMFGWEMVTIVGSIGGDQQIVFKRPFDERRSAEEAERVRAERENLIAAYEASTSSLEHDASTEEGDVVLVDLDAAERAQAMEARNAVDESTVRTIIETAAASEFPISDLVVTGRARGTSDAPSVAVSLTQDVTAAALVGPGQYRKSLVDIAVDQFQRALVGSGMVRQRSNVCGYGNPPGEASVSIKAIIVQEGSSVDVGSYRSTFCFDP